MNTTRPDEKPTNDRALSKKIEDTIHELEHANTQENIMKLIEALREFVSSGQCFYVPLAPKSSEELLTIPKLNLGKMTSGPVTDYRKVAMNKGGIAYTVFTSQEEMDLGQPTDYRLVPAGDLLALAKNDETSAGLIMNPWSLSVLLNKDLLTMVLKSDDEEEVEEEPEHETMLYIDHGEACNQEAEVVVNAAYVPFDFNEPGSRALLEACGDELKELCFATTTPKPGTMVITDAPNLKASKIFHAALPMEENESTLTIFITNILSAADEMGVKSIAIPAIGSEEADLEDDLPFPVIVAAGWFNAHPKSELNVTITCRKMDTYKKFVSYLFS